MVPAPSRLSHLNFQKPPRPILTKGPVMTTPAWTWTLIPSTS